MRTGGRTDKVKRRVSQTMCFVFYILNKETKCSINRQMHLCSDYILYIKSLIISTSFDLFLSSSGSYLTSLKHIYETWMNNFNINAFVVFII